MRLLHVLGERGYSGGEVQLAYLLEFLVARGHENRIVLQPEARFAEAAERLGIPVDRVRMRNSCDPLAWRDLRRVIRGFRPDLVHLACSRAHKLTAAAAFGLGRPMVATRRMDYRIKKHPLSRWLYGRAVRATVVISEAVRREIARIGVPLERLPLIYEGVDAARFARARERRAEARARLGLPESAIAIVCAATLRPRKGQRYLIDAFDRAAQTRPDAWLVLAGEGSDRDALLEILGRVRTHERILIPGQLPPEDCVAIADIACMPSLHEGLSVFTLEAQAAGVPVAASRVGGLPESVADGETGLLAAPADAGALSAVLARLLDDPELRARFGANARRRIDERFSSQAMATQTEALYERLGARG